VTATVQILLERVFDPLSLVKIVVAVAMVVGLSVLAEKVSTRVAGLLSGYPLGAAISLFFMGYEIDPGFAGQSAVYTVFGLIGTLAFVMGYQLVIRLVGGRAGLAAAGGSTLGGVAAYFGVASLLRYLPARLPIAVMAASAAILICTALFRRLKNVRIQHALRLSPAVLVLRALFAAGVIILITASARLVGPGWAGLLSAFPITMLPFVFIIHVSYRTEHVQAILKNVPRGLGAIVVYGTVVALSYPKFGVWLGTLAGYAAATVYLVVLHIPFLRKNAR
jgi:hypothetical protein